MSAFPIKKVLLHYKFDPEIPEMRISHNIIGYIWICILQKYGPWLCFKRVQTVAVPSVAQFEGWMHDLLSSQSIARVSPQHPNCTGLYSRVQDILQVAILRFRAPSSFLLYYAILLVNGTCLLNLASFPGPTGASDFRQGTASSQNPPESGAMP